MISPCPDLTDLAVGKGQTESWQQWHRTPGQHRACLFLRTDFIYGIEGSQGVWEGVRKRKAENLRNSKVTSIALPAAMGLFLHPPHGAEGLCCHFKHHFILTKAGLYVTALKSEHLSRQQNRKTSNCSGYPKLQQPSQLAPAAHKRDH